MTPDPYEFYKGRVLPQRMKGGAPPLSESPLVKGAGAYGKGVLKAAGYTATTINDAFGNLMSIPSTLGRVIGGSGGGGVAGEELGARVGELGSRALYPEGQLGPMIAPILLPGTKLWHVASEGLSKFEPHWETRYGPFTWFGRDIRTSLEPKSGAQIYPEDPRILHQVRVTEPLKILAPSDLETKGLRNLLRKAQEAFFSNLKGSKHVDAYKYHSLQGVDVEEMLRSLGYHGIATTTERVIPPSPMWGSFYKGRAKADRAVAVLQAAAAEKTKITVRKALEPAEPSIFWKKK